MSYGLWGFFLWRKILKRSSFFIDGFNLYHAIKKLRQPQFKWLNLYALMQRLISGHPERIENIYYFSAYASWLPQQQKRHQIYVGALENSGVKVVLGQFKLKDAKCQGCNFQWKKHEEKESDVNLALHVLNDAHRDLYDRAYIVSRDSDMKPAIEMVRQQFPKKEIFIVAPPGLGNSSDLISVATGKRGIKQKQLNGCLFPERIFDSNNNMIAECPPEWKAI